VVVAAFLAVAIIAPSMAQEAAPGSELEEIEGAIEERRQRDQDLENQAEQVTLDIAKVRAQIIDAAAAVQNQERRTTDAEREIDEIDRRYAERQASFERHSKDLQSTLAALALLARSPPDSLIAKPGEWRETVLGVRLLDDVVPELKARADLAAADAAALATLRDARMRGQVELTAAKEELSAERERVQRLLERKSSMQAALVAERRALTAEIAGLAAEAADVRDLIDRLAMARIEERARKANEAAERAVKAALEEAADGSLREDERVPNVARAQEPATAAEGAVTTGVPDDTTRSGSAEIAPRLAALPPAVDKRPPLVSSLPYPAHGDIVAKFNQRMDDGQPSLGLSIATRGRAQVVATRDGQVVFAGEFRGYGQLLIIEHDGGYHTLLSGFSRIDSAVGQGVVAGEPVGTMGTGVDSPTILYVEIRHNRQPIDPIPWLIAGDRKVSG
jgi:septal ring factor EnvC (AmiA/AmiB activator)